MYFMKVRFAALMLLASIPAGCSGDLSPSDESSSGASTTLATAASARGQEVHGTVVAGIQSTANAQVAFLSIPDVEVWIEEINTGQQSVPVTTDLAGRYIIPRQIKGDYRLCWRKSGWIAECQRKPFHLERNTHFPGLVRIQPERQFGGSDTGVVRGTALLEDESSCWYESEFFGREDTAAVELLSASGQVIQAIRANDHGDFVITRVPYGFFQIRTTCGTEVLRRGFLSSNVDMNGGTPVPLTLPNRRPAVQTAVAYRGGAGVRHAAAGDVVDVVAEATDPDGDALTFAWKLQNGSGTLTASTSSAVQWQLPTQPGRHDLYVLASDDHGGFHQHKISLQVESRQVVFSGKVAGNDGAKLEGAIVTVNGTSATAGAGGAFSLTLDRGDSYVLHIEARGYAELGRRVDLAMAGQTWVLTRASRQVIDPTVATVIEDKRKEWLRPRDKDIRRRPARVHLPGGILVDPQGQPANPANGPFHAYIATIDPTTEAMPGDYGAVDLQGQDRFLISFGAVFIEVRDASGTKYDLAPGTAADLDSPVQDPLLQDGNIPAEIDMWTFDPVSGDWRQDQGIGRFQGDRYRAELTTFSTHNADLQKVDPACVRVVVDPGVLALGDLRARIDVATGPGATRRYEFVIDDQNNVLHNLPQSTPFTLELFQGVPPGDVLIFAAPGNTGGAWGGVGIPPYPYDACNADMVVNFPSLPPAFLQYSKGTGDATRAAGYYAGIDPANLRTTLGSWWQVNGFDPTTGAGGTRTSFGNDNDLGFGRDMHCRASGADVACYVTNYGQPDQNPGNADLAQTAILADAVATVAMEYSAVEGFPAGDRIVKFYVFQGGQPTGPRVDSADLDKAGPKFVPNLCLICHGGNYNPANAASPNFNDINMGASFREFDTHSFTYPAANPQAAQEPSFFTQNQLVLQTNPAPAIVELIARFYAGGATVDPNAVPTGWQPASTGGSAAPQGFYLDVVGKSCRTCHVAQPEYNPLAPSGSAYPDWNSYAMFRDNRQLAYLLVCNAKQMPNALVTFKNFWLSLAPHRPQVFEDFVDAVSGWTPSLELDTSFGAPMGPCVP